MTLFNCFLVIMNYFKKYVIKVKYMSCYLENNFISYSEMQAKV